VLYKEENLMLISEVWAQTATSGTGDIFVSLMPLILIFAVFYFLLIRPQQKRQRVHRESIGAIVRGDKVLTGGGIFGSVVKVVDDSEVLVEIADGVRVRVSRMTIQDVLAKPEVAKVAKKKTKKNIDDGKTPKEGGDGIFDKIASKKQDDT
jgi:preprotein translocase subunit YajC